MRRQVPGRFWFPGFLSMPVQRPLTDSQVSYAVLQSYSVCICTALGQVKQILLSITKPIPVSFGLGEELCSMSNTDVSAPAALTPLTSQRKAKSASRGTWGPSDTGSCPCLSNGLCLLEALGALPSMEQRQWHWGSAPGCCWLGVRVQLTGMPWRGGGLWKESRKGLQRDSGEG